MYNYKLNKKNTVYCLIKVERTLPKPFSPFICGMHKQEWQLLPNSLFNNISSMVRFPEMLKYINYAYNLTTKSTDFQSKVDLASNLGSTINRFLTFVNLDKMEETTAHSLTEWWKLDYLINLSFIISLAHNKGSTNANCYDHHHHSHLLGEQNKTKNYNGPHSTTERGIWLRYRAVQTQHLPLRGLGRSYTKVWIRPGIWKR